MTSTRTEPDRLSLARLPTPIEAFDRIRNNWTVLVKRDDLTGSALSGNKARKLEYLFAEARARGARRVLTCGGVQSNHCRATAVAAARLGLGCQLFLRTSTPPGPDDAVTGRRRGTTSSSSAAIRESRVATMSCRLELGPGSWLPRRWCGPRLLPGRTTALCGPLAARARARR